MGPKGVPVIERGTSEDFVGHRELVADVGFLKTNGNCHNEEQDKDPPEVQGDLEEDFPYEEELVRGGHQEGIFNHVSIMNQVEGKGTTYSPSSLAYSAAIA